MDLLVAHNASATDRLDHEGAPFRMCIQNAGDAVFVPEGWGHAVLNLEAGAGLASEFVSYSLRSMKSHEVADKLAEWTSPRIAARWAPKQSYLAHNEELAENLAPWSPMRQYDGTMPEHAAVPSHWARANKSKDTWPPVPGLHAPDIAVTMAMSSMLATP